MHELKLFCLQAIYLDAQLYLHINWSLMVQSYNTVVLRLIYSVRIQNTLSPVLYMCKSSLCHVKFRVKSIYIGFFYVPIFDGFSLHLHQKQMRAVNF